MRRWLVLLILLGLLIAYMVVGRIDYDAARVSELMVIGVVW